MSFASTCCSHRLCLQRSNRCSPVSLVSSAPAIAEAADKSSTAWHRVALIASAMWIDRLLHSFGSSIRSLLLGSSIVCAFLLVVVPSGELLAQHDNIQALIEQLGADEFRLREEASMELMRIGEPALLALIAAEQGSDFEIRQRAKAIRSRIEREKYDALAQTFMRDPNPAASYGLPGWKSFSSAAGATRTAKRLFLEMIEKRRIIALSLEAIDGGQLPEGVFEGLPTEPQKRLWTVIGKTSTEIRRSLFEKGDRPVDGDVLALLVSAAVLDQPPQDLHDAIRSELHFGGVEQMMSQPSSRVCIRKLLGKWMLKAPLSMGEEVLGFSNLYKVPEGADMARRLLQAHTDKEVVSKALLCLARFGDVGDLDLIDKYVDDMTVLSLDAAIQAGPFRVEPSGGPRSAVPNQMAPAQVKYRRLVSDVALVAGLSIAKQELTEFFPGIQVDEDSTVTETTIGFPIDNPEIRAAAVKAWREFRARHNQPAS